MNIYVKIAYQVTEDELTAAFQTYGEVESAKIIMDRESGRSKGFAFVEMPDKEHALAAISGLDGTELGGRTLTVNEARPKAPRNDFGGGYNSY